MILHPSPVDITKSEANLLNSLPADSVVPALRELLETQRDPVVVSRTLDALLKIQDFDKVAFLVEALDASTNEDLHVEFVRRLADFPDPRGIKKLTDVLLHDEYGGARYAAAESLGAIGDASAMDALQHAAEHDSGTDYEGYRISDAARYALQQLRSR